MFATNTTRHDQVSKRHEGISRVWQEFLDLIKAVGPGSLAGVFVGAWLNRGSKGREVIHALRAADFAQAKEACESILSRQLKYRASLKTAAIQLSGIVDLDGGGLGSHPEEVRIALRKDLSGRLLDEIVNLDRLSDEMTEIVSHVGVRYPDSRFHDAAQMLAVSASVTVSLVRAERLESSSEGPIRIKGYEKAFEQLVQTFNRDWAEWKGLTERATVDLDKVGTFQAVARKVRSLPGMLRWRKRPQESTQNDNST